MVNSLYIVKFIIVMYFFYSTIEWILHNKVMHGDPIKLRKFPIIGEPMAYTATTHVNHHKDVNMDMYLESNNLSSSLYFSWNVLLELIIIGIIFSPLILKLLKLSFKQFFIINAIVGVVYCVLWNNLHVDMHGIKDKIKLKDGITNFPGLLSRGPIYNYLWKYHATHHLQKGGSKKNFNIILPGADYLFGTYINFCYDNEKYCEETSDKRCLSKQKKCLTNNDVLK